MQTYRDLKLIGNLSELERVIEKIEASLEDGWTRARDKEAKLKKYSPSDQFVFLTPKDNSIPSASLHLTYGEDGYLYVCTIAPAEMGKLSKEKYNLILDVFHSKFIEPAVDGLDIRVVTTPAEINIDNSMSPELSATLKHFSDSANKSTGSGHPNDEKRFYDFIVQAHHDKSSLDESTLRKLLIDERWPEEFADDLSSRYSSGRDLLKQYDS